MLKPTATARPASGRNWGHAAPLPDGLMAGPSLSRRLDIGLAPPDESEILACPGRGRAAQPGALRLGRGRRASAAGFADRLRQGREDLEQVPDDTDVGDPEDG